LRHHQTIASSIDLDHVRNRAWRRS
jgi:hypothetical protein